MDDKAKQDTPAAVRFGWFSFGVVFTFGLFVLFAMLLDEGLMAKPRWRECAPAHRGAKLVSSTQYDNRVECFYELIDPNNGFKPRRPGA